MLNHICRGRFFVYWIRVWDLLVIVGSIKKRGMAKEMEVSHHRHY